MPPSVIRTLATNRPAPTLSNTGEGPDTYTHTLIDHTHTHIDTHATRPNKCLPTTLQEKGQAHGVFFEHLPGGKTLPEMGLSPEQQYLYLEAPGLGGKGMQRCVRACITAVVVCRLWGRE